MRTEDLDGAVAAYRKALAQSEQVYGPEHPDQAYVLTNLGNALQIQGKNDEALVAYKHAVAIREARLGETLPLVSTLGNMAACLNELNRFDEARAALERALAIVKAKLGPDDPQLVLLNSNLAVALAHLDRADDARAVYTEIIEQLDREGGKDPNLAVNLINRGLLESKRGRCKEALPDFERLTRVFAELLGKDSFYQIDSLDGAGRCLVLLGRPADAIAPLERALQLKAPGSAEVEQAQARFFLGRALVESGRDRARGMLTARAARAKLASFGDDAKDETAEAAAWLKKR